MPNCLLIQTPSNLLPKNLSTFTWHAHCGTQDSSASRYPTTRKMLLILEPGRFNDSFIFLLIKYQFRPLPTDPAELGELANDLQVPHKRGLDSALLQKIIDQKLISFRQDAPYIVFLLSPLFAAIAFLVILFLWISNGIPL